MRVCFGLGLNWHLEAVHDPEGRLLYVEKRNMLDLYISYSNSVVLFKLGENYRAEGEELKKR